MESRSDQNARTTAPAGSPPLAGERVAFTGTLASMTHQQARDLVSEHGGTATAHVSRQTTMLVVGEEGWPLDPDGEPSQKLRHVQELNAGGLDIRIVTESDWLYLLGLDERRREVHRQYTPAMLSRLLGVPVGAIRGWARAGLIRPVRTVYRLPYFDFQEVAGARRLMQLLEEGVSPGRLKASLDALHTVLPGVERPLAQLDVLSHGSRLLYRDEKSLVETTTGQRCFEFGEEFEGPESEVGGQRSEVRGQESGVRSQESEDRGSKVEDRGDHSPLTTHHSPAQSSIVKHQASIPSDSRIHWSAGEWLREGCRLLAADDPSAAVEALRLALMERPGDPEVNFHLAEALYRTGNTAAALERYYAAVEGDHDFIEAWTQIGCLHAEAGDDARALEAFDVALAVHADYPDAHWQKADVLDRLGRADEAALHWRSYLEHDSRGPWAEAARQRLEQAAAEQARS